MDVVRGREANEKTLGFIGAHFFLEAHFFGKFPKFPGNEENRLSSLGLKRMNEN